MVYRHLLESEIEQLCVQGCSAEDWQRVKVKDGFQVRYIHNTRFSGDIELGIFDSSFTRPGGIVKHSGVRNATLHNTRIEDNCIVENINNYIANYSIGEGSIIENCDLIIVDGESNFGNGIEIAVLNEMGGREVSISDKLSAHVAYLMALYRHRPKLISKLRDITAFYAQKHSSAMGSIGRNVLITNTGSIKNVRIGDGCLIEGASRLSNGSINSNATAPVYVGRGVICDNFIISSGSKIDSGATIHNCFVGQSCILGHHYSASDSLFFCNCQGENGEACSIFAGPYTVTHHKSTLLIAGMFSFMNAGSGSNQSNHMYKLGPIHQGAMERGAKTTSDSYILWPSRVGAFSLVMGRHVNHSDTSNLPFSYLIEQNNTTFLVPGVNLRSVGTIRDAQKWAKRDKRTDPNKLDLINYNLLSPYTVQKMFRGIETLESLRKASGELSDVYSFHSANIRNSALHKGIDLYTTAIHKFMGNSIITRLKDLEFSSDEHIRQRLIPDTEVGSGEWVDISGLIAPKSEIDNLIDAIENGSIYKLKDINAELERIHKLYYTYEWRWAYEKIEAFYGIKPENITAADIISIVEKWREAVVAIDRMVYEDARKEFSLAARTGFGADGNSTVKDLDFEQVRGDFESNEFVKAIVEHIGVKSALGQELIDRVKHLA